MTRLLIFGILALTLLGCGSSTPPPSPSGEALSRTHKGHVAQNP